MEMWTMAPEPMGPDDPWLFQWKAALNEETNLTARVVRTGAGILVLVCCTNNISDPSSLERLIGVHLAVFHTTIDVPKTSIHRHFPEGCAIPIGPCACPDKPGRSHVTFMCETIDELQ